MKKHINQLLDLIFPSGLYCICCGKIIDSSMPYHLCTTCMSQVKWSLGRTCSRCGKPLSDTDPAGTCYSCREHEHFYDRGYSCAEYGSCERALIFSLKYNGRTDIAASLGEAIWDMLLARGVLSEGVTNTERYDLIIPVPMSRSKLRSRGYNQAELIARELSRRSGIPCNTDILVRARSTRALRGLSPEERRNEMTGAFARGRTPDIIRGRNFLLLDDIYTTGATIDACTLVLKANGAGRVDFVSFASGADVVK